MCGVHYPLDHCGMPGQVLTIIELGAKHGTTFPCMLVVSATLLLHRESWHVPSSLVEQHIHVGRTGENLSGNWDGCGASIWFSGDY
jgi:hypothetical protein